MARRSHRVAPEGGIMATKITRDIIESYLNCKYKGHLKLTGESGTQVGLRGDDHGGEGVVAGAGARQARRPLRRRGRLPGGGRHRRDS